MKGYFSRLLQQTGITFRSVSTPRSDAFGLPRTGPGEHEAVASLHVDEEKLTAPQPPQAVQKIPENVRGNDGSSDQISETEHIKSTLITEMFMNESAQQPQGRKPRERKPSVIEREIQLPLEGSQPQSKNNARALLEKDEAVEFDAVRKEQILPLSKPVEALAKVSSPSAFIGDPGFKVIENQWIPAQKLCGNDKKKSFARASVILADQEQEKADARKALVKSGDQIGHAETLQAYLKEVREWVAETPEVNDEELKSKEIVKTNNTDKKKHTSLGEKEIFAASYSKPIESQQREQPEIHDFHLSIGTISLTIEAPHKEAPSKAAPKIIGESKTRRENVGTRLSRHYLR